MKKLLIGLAAVIVLIVVVTAIGGGSSTTVREPDTTTTTIGAYTCIDAVPGLYVDDRGLLMSDERKNHFIDIDGNGQDDLLDCLFEEGAWAK